jgi:hypothetical protein
MRERGGAPWASIDRGRLKVRLREEASALPPRAETPTLWVNSYFLNSLKTVGATVFGKAA